ncbi:hypothetical protein H5410_031350 [Solanum commersonii]|uniref:Uncharacterized protein n=1 Tax=Solanum commersonii TaxID=4109 RepID=A0A9J5YLF9_SOLCO|nr:hypothetical protein H5410_031350 [Solanum commersonii]
MEWISLTLREASKSKGNSFRIWKKKVVFSEIYYAWNCHKFGRYISFIIVRGRRRTVIIISELTLNSGSTGIAKKVGKFISSHKRGVATYRSIDWLTTTFPMLIC